MINGKHRNRDRINSMASNDEMEEKKRRAAYTAVSSAALLSSMVDKDLQQYDLSLITSPTIK